MAFSFCPIIRVPYGAHGDIHVGLHIWNVHWQSCRAEMYFRRAYRNEVVVSLRSTCAQTNAVEFSRPTSWISVEHQQRFNVPLLHYRISSNRQPGFELHTIQTFTQYGQVVGSTKLTPSTSLGGLSGRL